MDKEWCSWFCGFVDGEGSFNIESSGTPRFQIQLRNDDRDVLDEIALRIGVGRVTDVPYRGTLKGHDLCMYRTSSLSSALTIQSTIETGMGGPWEDWFAGLVDGEGSFVIHSTGSLIFQLKLREDDRQILESVCSWIGVGSVKNVSYSKDREDGKNSSDQALYSCYGTANALKLVDVLEGRMRTKKRTDFDIWSEAVRESAKLNEGRRHPGRRQMMLEYKRLLEDNRRVGIAQKE